MKLSSIVFTAITLCISSVESYVPPDLSAKYRMRGINSNKCIFINAETQAFGHVECSDDNPEQYFMFDIVTTDGNGFVWLMLRNAITGRCLYSNSDGRFRHEGCYQPFVR